MIGQDLVSASPIASAAGGCAIFAVCAEDAELVVGFLITLAAKALPEAQRLSGPRLAITVGVCAVVSALGMAGGVAGLF